MQSSIVLSIPQGQDTLLEYIPGLCLALPFLLEDARVEKEGHDLLLLCPDGQSIRINHLFSGMHLPEDIDLTLRDVEGHDWSVFEALNMLHNTELSTSNDLPPSSPEFAHLLVHGSNTPLHGVAALDAIGHDGSMVPVGIATLGLITSGPDIDALLPGALHGLIPLNSKQTPPLPQASELDDMLPSFEAAYNVQPPQTVISDRSEEMQQSVAVQLREIV